MVRLVEITFRRVILLSFNVKSVESEAMRKLLRTLHPMELDDHLLDVPLHVPKLYDRASPRSTGVFILRRYILSFRMGYIVSWSPQTNSKHFVRQAAARAS